MEQKLVLHYIPGRKVSVSVSRKYGQHTLVSVPKKLWEPLGLGKATHKAILSCYEIEQIYCKVQLHAVGVEVPRMCSPPLIHSAEVVVSVTGTNAFVSINSAITDVMGISQKTHCIDWTCMRNYNVFGVIRPQRPSYTSATPY